MECPGALSTQGEDEMLEMNPFAHVSCLSHRCQITSGRSARATSPCAAGAATAAEPTRAAATAASSEDSRNNNNNQKNINLLLYFLLLFS